jgi:Protein of unknown function (DUF3300)
LRVTEWPIAQDGLLFRIDLSQGCAGVLLGDCRSIMLRVFAILLGLVSALAPASVFAQAYPSPTPETPVFSPAELDQMLAPVALYPDALLAQILMAATYPLDVIAADRWVQQPGKAQLHGDALAAALGQQPWDPSVKALVPFPQVLQMMDAHLDWMQRLGDAFLAQPDDVMAAVQRLRAQALATGNLQSTPQQTIEVQGPDIVIVPANPTVVYVPYYDPTLVYGVWPYPAYPPYYWPPPPGLVISGFFFGVGIAIVADYWGWSDFDWRHHDIHIDRDRFNRINYHRAPVTSEEWQHDPARRGAVPYRDAATRARYQRPLPGPAPATRQQYRGYASTPIAPSRTAAPATQTTTHRTPAQQAAPPPAPPPSPPQQTQQPSTRPQISRPPTQPQATRPQAQPKTAQPTAPAQPTARPQAQPRVIQPTMPTQQVARPPGAAVRPLEQPSSRPVAPQIARPAAPQVIRPAVPQSIFQPSAGSAARIESQRGQQSLRTPVAAPHASPPPHPASAPRTAPTPSQGAAPASQGAPSGGQRR